MSLVGADAFYKLDAKLKEIFSLRKNIPFAGIGIVFVGDLLQIPPVNDSFIFGEPTNKGSQVYDLTEFEGELLVLMWEKHQIKD